MDRTAGVPLELEETTVAACNRRAPRALLDMRSFVLIPRLEVRPGHACILVGHRDRRDVVMASSCEFAQPSSRPIGARLCELRGNSPTSTVAGGLVSQTPTRCRSSSKATRHFWP